MRWLLHIIFGLVLLAFLSWIAAGWFAIWNALTTPGMIAAHGFIALGSFFILAGIAMSAFIVWAWKECV